MTIVILNMIIVILNNCFIQIKKQAREIRACPLLHFLYIALLFFNTLPGKEISGRNYL